MKTNIAFILLSLCLISPAVADSGEWKYGVRLGLPISDIRMTDRVYNHIDSDKPDIWMHYFTRKLGLNFGAFVRYEVLPEIFLGAEPGYIIKGAGFSDERSKLSLHYLNLPILLKYKLSDRWGILAGPEFSTLVKASLDYNGLIIDMKEFYATGIETSVNLGLEFEATEQFWLGLRYNYGLTTVSETVWYDEAGEVLGAVREYNEYLLLYLALGFGG